jgi:hypothetical protein
MNRAPSKQRDWQTHLIHRLVIVKSITHALCRTPPLLRKNTKRERGWLSWKPSPANWSGPSFKNKQEDGEGYLPVRFIDEGIQSATALILSGRQSVLQASLNTNNLHQGYIKCELDVT